MHTFLYCVLLPFVGPVLNSVGAPKLDMTSFLTNDSGLGFASSNREKIPVIPSVRYLGAISMQSGFQLLLGFALVNSFGAPKLATTAFSSYDSGIFPSKSQEDSNHTLTSLFRCDLDAISIQTGSRPCAPSTSYRNMPLLLWQYSFMHIRRGLWCGLPSGCGATGECSNHHRISYRCFKIGWVPGASIPPYAFPCGVDYNYDFGEPAPAGYVNHFYSCHQAQRLSGLHEAGPHLQGAD